MMDDGIEGVEESVELVLDPKATAVVAIDLQNAVVGREMAPHAAADVVRKSVRIADALRAKGGLVVFVRVKMTEFMVLPADVSFPRPAHIPPEASELVPELRVQPEDAVVTKRQWGAFYETELEQRLRWRGIRTIVMTGIATNFGVESTARGAMDHGYELVFAEDAMTSMGAELHEFAVKNIFPRMGRVRSTEQVLASLQ
jgi:nicotinamidase-related amidase